MLRIGGKLFKSTTDSKRTTQKIQPLNTKTFICKYDTWGFLFYHVGGSTQGAGFGLAAVGYKGFTWGDLHLDMGSL